MAHPLIPVLRRLVDTVAAALPDSDVSHVRDLLDANQPELALEWLTDAVAQSELKDPSLRQLLVQLGTQLGIAESIRDRLAPTPRL